MAQIYKSPTYIKGAAARPDSQVGTAQETLTVTIPAGKSLAVDDLIYFGKIGEGIEILTVELTSDPFSSNASPALAASLGCVPSTTAKVGATVRGVTGYNSIYALTQVISGASSARLNMTKSAGGGTGDTFNALFPIPTVKSDLVMVVGTIAAATDLNTVDRTITLRVDYQYAYPGRYPTGVSDPTYPFAGSVVYGSPIEYNYGTAQNGTPNAP